MRIIFYSYLMLSIGGWSDEQIFETQTARVGENIKLTCTRRTSETFLWIKLVSGNFPKILGKSFKIQSADERIRAVTELETFVLHITKAQKSDAGDYFCVQTVQQDVKFLKGTLLKVQEQVTIASPPDPVHQENTVNQQCSVLHDLRSQTYPEVDSVICMNAKSHEYHPSFNPSALNGGDEDEKDSEGVSTRKCFSIYFRNFSSSDSQTCYCAVGTCVESVFPKDDTEVNKSDPKNNTILFLLCVALVISLIFITFLIYKIETLKRKSHVDCNVDNTAAVALQTNATSFDGQKNPQTEEDSLFYSAPTFKKARRLQTSDPKPSETIYTDVRTLGLD